jgi:hypothetical protein
MPASFEPIETGQNLLNWIEQEMRKLVRNISVGHPLKMMQLGDNVSLSIDFLSLNDVGRIHMFFISDVIETTTLDQDENPVKWTYKAKRAKKTALGYGGWVLDDTDETEYNAYNSLENGNSGSGRQQNGINHDSTLYNLMNGNWKMEPLVRDTYHPGIFVKFPTPSNPSATTTEVWFMPYQGEDGVCPP